VECCRKCGKNLENDENVDKNKGDSGRDIQNYENCELLLVAEK
jgi:hypothetical protein